MTTDNNISIKTRRLKLMSCLGLVCLLIPVIILLMWIHAFNLGSDQPSRVKIYLDYFPSFLSANGITLIQIIFCIIAIVISSLSLKLRILAWKLLNIVIIIGSSLMILLQIWGLL